jgi:uncharacterized repeat protein (TIGR04138 family)
MAEQPTEIDWKQILKSAGPYPIQAFHFVREGLSYTAQHIHGDEEAVGEPHRHISGQQLCHGLREFAIDKYGLLAHPVLDHWHIRGTADFGRIVYAMVDAGLMSKTASDSLTDFRDVYDFGEAFSSEKILGRLGAA